jgi:hypothetical protein
MANPFPGMNPYLEGYLWPGFHGDYCAEIKKQLARKLTPRYYPYSTRYLVLEEVDELAIATEIVPDAGIVQESPAPLPQSSTVLTAPPLRMRTVIRVPVPHYRIEIRDRLKRQLVTAIEFLSPSNKRGTGRRKYLRKRERILNSDAHLIEIDLLHQGERVPMLDPYPQQPYFVLVSRVEQRPLTEVWPIALEQPLPTIPVPLKAGDPDVPLDLQLALKNVYDSTLYDEMIDYQEHPDAPLTLDESAWVDRLLRQAGRRQ